RQPASLACRLFVWFAHGMIASRLALMNVFLSALLSRRNIRLVLTFLVITKSLATVAQITRDAKTEANFDGPAELPRLYVKSALADTPAPGRKTTVKDGDSLQRALDGASCGDTLELQAGASFGGDFHFPAAKCDDTHWIVIRTSAPDSQLPPEG